MLLTQSLAEDAEDLVLDVLVAVDVVEAGDVDDNAHTRTRKIQNWKLPRNPTIALGNA